MSVRVIIADDHPIVREGLKALLSGEPNIAVLAEAENGSQALARVDELQPDVLVLDISMEGMHGLEVTRKMTERYPDVAVLILSMHDDKRYVTEALRAGARGFVVKSCACAELVGAIHDAAVHQRYLSPSLCGTLVPDELRAPPPLSKRELEVLTGLAEGNCTKEIAFALNIGTKTVETYRHNLMKKLNLTNLAELTKHAIRSGLVSLS